MSTGEILALIGLVISILTWLLRPPVRKAISQARFKSIRARTREARGQLRAPSLIFLEWINERSNRKNQQLADDDDKNLLMPNIMLPIMPLHQVRLQLVKGKESRETQQKQREANAKILPIETHNKRFKSMVESIRTIEQPKPNRLEARCTYRLLSIDNADGQLTLRFDQSPNYTYFNQINFNSLLEYELARQEFKDGRKKTLRLPFRKYVIQQLIKDDFRNFEELTIFMGVSTLVLLRMPDQFRILMHKRENTATVSETYHLLPAGEFQPINSKPGVFKKDFNIWHAILREYSEEIQKIPEAKGETAESFNYQEDQFRRISDRIPEDDRYFLGFGLDPVTFKAELLTCVVIGLEDFIATLPGENREEQWNFYQLLKENEEGEILWHAGQIGIGFDEIEDYADSAQTLNAARAALRILSNNADFFLQKYPLAKGVGSINK